MLFVASTKLVLNVIHSHHVLVDVVLKAWTGISPCSGELHFKPPPLSKIIATNAGSDFLLSYDLWFCLSSTFPQPAR